MFTYLDQTRESDVNKQALNREQKLSNLALVECLALVYSLDGSVLSSLM